MRFPSGVRSPCEVLQVTAVEDMPWRMHEFTLTDPSGNTIRVGRSVSDD